MENANRGYDDYEGYQEYENYNADYTNQHDLSAYCCKRAHSPQKCCLQDCYTQCWQDGVCTNSNGNSGELLEVPYNAYQPNTCLKHCARIPWATGCSWIPPSAGEPKCYVHNALSIVTSNEKGTRARGWYCIVLGSGRAQRGCPSGENCNLSAYNWKKGICLDSQRDAIRYGKTQLSNKDNPEKCLQACRRVAGSTGCEYVGDGSNLCYVHTEPIEFTSLDDPLHRYESDIQKLTGCLIF